jgi:hypothetical protein
MDDLRLTVELGLILATTTDDREGEVVLDENNPKLFGYDA